VRITGWGLLDELMEPDLDPLRGRDDFHKLLAGRQTRDKAQAAKEGPGGAKSVRISFFECSTRPAP
jgi:hypothetical protein